MVDKQTLFRTMTICAMAKLPDIIRQEGSMAKENSGNHLAFRILTLAAFLFFVAVNVLAIAFPDWRLRLVVSFQSYPSMITPATLTLLIWVPIALLLGAYAVWQLTSKTAPRVLTHKINVCFAIASAARVAWSLAWFCGAIFLTMIFMATVLVCLIVIGRLIDAADLTLKGQFFIKLPFSLYFGWISAATFTNAAYLIASFGVDRLGQYNESVAIITLSAATLLVIWTGIHFKSTAYLLACIWAVVGILIRHTSITGFNWQYPRVIHVATASLILLHAAFIAEIVLKLRKTPKEKENKQRQD